VEPLATSRGYGEELGGGELRLRLRAQLDVHVDVAIDRGGRARGLLRVIGLGLGFRLAGPGLG